jgi:hypothetical protein
VGEEEGVGMEVQIRVEATGDAGVEVDRIPGGRDPANLVLVLVLVCSKGFSCFTREAMLDSALRRKRRIYVVSMVIICLLVWYEDDISMV